MMNNEINTRVDIVPLDMTRRDIKKFVLFSWEIYKDNDFWPIPLINEKIDFILKGPYHEVGVIQPFLAYRDKKIVGRIIAHIDRRHNTFYNEKRGCFGFFECINDRNVSRALFQSAENWLAERGMSRMEGPYNFLLYDPSGLLLDDYNRIPALELNYNPPYYVDLYADYGLEKSSDWYAYLFEKTSTIPPVYYKIRERLLRPVEKNGQGLVLRQINLKNYRTECKKIFSVFNKAWEKNWGHYPLTDNQLHFFATQLKQLLVPELIIIAEYNNEIAGFMLSIPDAAPAIRKANGRLFPLGLIKILREMKKIRQLRTMLLGVMPEHRKKGLEALFILESIERGKMMGYESSDLSLVVETNHDMIRSLEHLDVKRYKTYRFLSKPVIGH